MRPSAQNCRMSVRLLWVNIAHCPSVPRHPSKTQSLSKLSEGLKFAYTGHHTIENHPRVNKQGWRRFVKFKRSRYHVVSKLVLKFSDRLHVPTYRYYVHKCSGRIFIFVWIPLVKSANPLHWVSVASSFPVILKARIDPFCLSAGNLVHTAAAEIDQVKSRNMGRLVADRYYGLLCLCDRTWIHQKRSLGCSISTIQWPALAGRDRLILPPFCLPSADLEAARASTPTQ